MEGKLTCAPSAVNFNISLCVSVAVGFLLASLMLQGRGRLCDGGHHPGQAASRHHPQLPAPRPSVAQDPGSRLPCLLKTGRPRARGRWHCSLCSPGNVAEPQARPRPSPLSSPWQSHTGRTDMRFWRRVCPCVCEARVCIEKSDHAEAFRSEQWV